MLLLRRECRNRGGPSRFLCCHSKSDSLKKDWDAAFATLKRKDPPKDEDSLTEESEQSVSLFSARCTDLEVAGVCRTQETPPVGLEIC